MDDNFNDYFTDDAPEEQPQVHQETEQEREEREIKEATIERRGNSIKMLLMLIIAAMALFLGWWIWQYYFHPYRVSQEKGWIMQVSNEGTVFTNVNSALKKAGVEVKGSNYIGGLGGRNISAADIEKIYTDIANGAHGVEFIGIGGGDNG